MLPGATTNSVAAGGGAPALNATGPAHPSAVRGSAHPALDHPALLHHYDASIRSTADPDSDLKKVGMILKVLRDKQNGKSEIVRPRR